jgi:xanthine dehydrogenase accessory factor
MLEILQTVDEWLGQGRQIALATVVETWGSAPRGVGAKMAVTPEMAMIGSVSGGCVETAVIEEGITALKTGKPRLLHFGVSDDSAWEVGLTCGGKISVFVEPLNAEWWRAAREHVLNDTRATTLTILEGDHAGEKVLVDGEGKVRFHDVSAPNQAALLLAAEAKTVSGRMSVAGLNVMADVHRPRPHLIIIGGVHVALPLQAFARQTGFRVSLIDPRGVFASQERFPEVQTILHSYPDKALPQLGLDPDTYIAVLTHDPKIDDKALITALPSNAAYIGVLSSARTHQQRVERLKKAGLTDAQIARIHTPIGIDIQARTPEEIALCIMAEIVAVRNGVSRPAIEAAARV